MRTFPSEERGQSIVIVALLFVLLMGFAALAFDGGRFYVERRFLQNAADAAALACAQKLSSGGTTSEAVTAATTLLTSYNLRGDPNATGVTVAATPVYGTWFNTDATDKRNLSDGVVATSTDCRVAIHARVRMYFMSIVNPGLGTLDVPANAHAIAGGGMLPIVVNRYEGAPGPAGPPFTAGSGFHDYTKQETQDDICNQTSPGNCPDATLLSPGRERVLVGNGYRSSASDFRGFIALDVRDYSTLDNSGNPIHQYYNQAGSMNTNTLKAQEATYFKAGYPGPDLIAYDPNANPAQAGLQVGTMSGNDTGIGVSEMKRYYKPDAWVLVQLFDGQVLDIPDFTITEPTSLAANSPSGAPATCCTFRVGANQNFSSANDVVDLAMVRDAFVAPDGTAKDDTPSELQDFAFSPDNFVPAGGLGTQVSLTGFQVTGGLGNGIYSVILKGTAYQPPHPGTGTQLSTHQKWVPLNVGGVSRDFSLDFTATAAEVTGGATGSFPFQLATGSAATAFGASSSVSFGIDRGTCASGQIRLDKSGGSSVCGTATISPTTAIPDKNNPPTVTISVPSTGLADGVYTFILRGRGSNQASQPVVHVQPLQLYVNTTAGGGKSYVQVQGYAVFEIVICTTQDQNAVCGRAITGAANNPNTMAVGRRPRLLPWATAPF